MKSKIIVIFLAVIAAILILNSCRYKEGPAISFRTAENRLLGRWEVTHFTVDGIDCTNVYRDKCNCTFSASKQGVTRLAGLRDCIPDGRNISGSYEFVDNTNKTKLRLGFYTLWNYTDTTLYSNTPITYFGPIGNLKTSFWTIIKLKNNNMKLRCNYENIEYELEFDKIK